MDLTQNAWNLCETAMKECRNKELIGGLKAEVDKLKAELAVAQAGTKLAIAVAEEEDPRIANLREALEYLIKMRVIKCLHNPTWPDLSCAKCKADKALKGGE